MRNLLDWPIAFLLFKGGAFFSWTGWAFVGPIAAFGLAAFLLWLLAGVKG